MKNITLNIELKNALPEKINDIDLYYSGYDVDNIGFNIDMIHSIVINDNKTYNLNCDIEVIGNEDTQSIIDKLKTTLKENKLLVNNNIEIPILILDVINYI